MIDWIIEKNQSGYKMVNSVKRYNDARVIKWVLREAARAFQGVTGSFD